MKLRSPATPRPTLPMLIGGALTTVAALLTRLTVGSPLTVAHKLEALLILPPLWVLSLLWLVHFTLLGAAAGFLLGCPTHNPHQEAAMWRGCTFMVLAAVLSLVWYTLLFGKLCLLPSWLCLLLSAGAAAVCAISWRQTKKGAAVVAFAFSLWQVCLFFLQFAVILHT